MAAPRPGNEDRGWNDPPMFDYQGASNTNTGSPQHTKLNKRVAYPMSTDMELPTGTATLLNPSDGPPRLPPIHILPPTTSTTTPTPVPVVVPSLSPTTDPCGDSILAPAIFSPTACAVPGIARAIGAGEISIKDMPSLLMELSLQTEESLLEYIKDGLHSAADSVKDALQGRAMEDVKKKVALMGEWWTSGKISESVKSQLGSLVAALNKQLVEEAHELHLALMINHTTEVNQWMVGIKRIIQELRAKVAASVVNQDQGQDEPKVVDPCLLLENANLVQVAQPEAKDSESAESKVDTPSSPPAKDSDTAAEGGS